MIVNLESEVKEVVKTKKEEKNEDKEEKEKDGNNGNSEIKKLENDEIDVTETPVETTETTEILPVIPEQAGIQSESTEPDLSTEAPADTEEYVQIEYKTQGPQITEQETEKGKLVTVSSADEQDCELLNPNNTPEALPNDDEAINLESTAPAGLLNSVSKVFSNIFSSIKKFLVADLEEAVSNVMDAVIPPPEVVEPIPVESTDTQTNEPVEESIVAEPAEELVATENTEIVETTEQIEDGPLSEPLSETETPTKQSENEELVVKEITEPDQPPSTTDPSVVPLVEESEIATSPTTDVEAPRNDENENVETTETTPVIPEPALPSQGGTSGIQSESTINENEETPEQETLDSSVSAQDGPASGWQGNDTVEVPPAETSPSEVIPNSAYQDCLANQAHLKDVLAYTTIPEIYKLGQEHLIKIKWTNNDGQEMPFTAYDLNDNGKIDYLEWTVPHLSEQVFEIIFISKAWMLDQNLEIQEDIYDQVKTKEATWQEGTYATVPADNYVRVTFEQILDNTKDITIHAKPTNQGNPGTIEVYTENGNTLLATFPEIDHEDTYKILLTELSAPTDTFDLKIINAPLDIDYIVDPTGWMTGWSFRKKITIQTANVDADLTDFPLYVKLAADADIGDEALATGYDIRFTATDGTTELPYERESWTGGAGADATANFWVKTPVTTAGTGATDIYIYYGKADASDGADPTNVWDSSYAGVWHLGETLTNVPRDETIYDSTGNNNDGTMTDADGDSDETTGQTGGAIDFNGDADYVDMPDGGGSSLSVIGNLTVTMWVKTTEAALKSVLSFGEYLDGGYYVIIRDGKMELSTSQAFSVPNTALNNGSWRMYGATLNGTSVTHFLDGDSDGTGTLLETFNYQKTRNLGASWDGSSAYFDGLIDEVRISSTARSAEWIKFEYANINEADAELTWAAEEPSSVGASESYWVGGTGNWSDAANHWACSSGGSASADCAPGTSTDVYFDSSSGGGTATIDSASVSVVDLIESSDSTTIATSSNGITVTGDMTVVGTVSGATAVTMSDSGKVLTMGDSSTFSAPLTMGSDLTIFTDTGNTGAISGVISGGYNLTKTGAGTLTLSGANTYTGTTTIAEGTVSANKIVVSSDNSSLGNASSAVILGDADSVGTLVSTQQNTWSYIRGFTVSAGGGEFDNNATYGTQTVATGGITANGLFTVGGSRNLYFNAPVMADGGTAGSLAHVGTATLLIYGANTFTGGLTVKEGNVYLFNAAAAGTGTITVGDTGGSADATISTVAVTITNPVTVALGSSGKLTIYGGSSAKYDGEITLNNDLTIGSNTNPGTIFIRGGIVGTGDITVENATTGSTAIFTVSVNNVGTITNTTVGTGGLSIAAPIGSNVTNVIQNSDTSALSLGGNSVDYTGGVLVKRGTLALSTDNDAAGSGTITLGDGAVNESVLLSGASYSFANPITVASISSGTTTIKRAGSNTTFSGAITLNDDLILAGDGNTLSITTGGITGTGDITIAPTTTGAVTVSASVNHTGTITNNGTSSGTTTISAAIGSNVTSITQNSATSALTLSGANTYTGDITNTLGTLNLAETNEYDILTMEADTTTTITSTKTITLTDLVCNGSTDHLCILNSSTPASAHILTTSTPQIATDYLSVQDSTPVEENTWYAGANGTLVSNTGYWNLATNTAPNVPTLVSPADDTDTSDNTPTLSANYSDPDVGDVGTTNYGIATSAENCLAQTFVSGCGGTCTGISSETADEDEDTTWTPDSSIGDDGTYYWCTQNNDGALTSAWTSMGSFNLDTAPPTTVADSGDYTFGETSTTAVTVTLICSDGSGSGCLATLYCTSDTNDCTPGVDGDTFGSYTDPFEISTEGTTYVRFYSTDNVSNTETPTNSETIIISVPVSSETASSRPGSRLILPPEEETIDKNLFEQIVQQIQNLQKTITGQPEQIEFPPIAESVPEEAPFPLLGWEYMKVKPIGGPEILPIESSISFLANKFPQLDNALKGLGIDINNLDDISKIAGREFYVPGLTKTVLAESEISEINKFTPEFGPPTVDSIKKTAQQEAPVVKVEELKINKFASIQGVPLVKLTQEAINKIPTNVVFARSLGGLIDFNTAVSMNNQGEVLKKIHALANNPVQFVIKPDLSAKRVVGFLTLAKPLNESQDISLTIKEAEEKSLLVEKFEYMQIRPGVFLADITAPSIAGEYDILTVIQYKDDSIDPKETSITAVIDSEGYVYEQLKENRLRINKAEVSLYWLNSETQEYELWPAEKFFQKNPIITDESGKYSFLAPEGDYYIFAKSEGYSNYRSEKFSVEEGDFVIENIELKKKFSLAELFSWQALIALSLIIITTLLTALVVILIKKGRRP